MSALTERIAAEHLRWRGLGRCKCGTELSETECGYPRDPYTMHIVEVTEAAVREQVAREIEAGPLADAWDQGFTAGRPVEYIGTPRPSRADNPYRATLDPQEPTS